MGAAGRAAAGANPIKVCFVDGGALWDSYVRGGALWDLCVRGGALWDLYVHGGTLRDVYVALCASCPVRVPSAAFNVRLPSRSVGSPKETANTPLPVRTRLPAAAGPCTPHYVVVQIKCRGSVSGGRIPGPAACFRGICRGQFAYPPPPRLGVGRDLKSPSDGEDGARNGGVL